MRFNDAASYTALTALTLGGVANAFWRMPCRGRTGLARIDPIVDPGKVSSHSHSIQGSSNFAMDVTSAELRNGDCTSCQVTQDKSAYWTPPLYFQYTNGTTVIVPQMGGMLAYYLLYGDDVKAFPENFRMLAGDPYQRNFTLPVPDPAKPWTGEDKTQKALAQKAIGFNCLHYDVNPPEGTLYRHFLPDKQFLDENCHDGVRVELMFPSCWNGKDTDSDDHQSHMRYPDQTITGTCPEGFETRVVSLMYETIWATETFKGVDGQFVFSNGDPTGYGYHGDFITGWDHDFLQNAVNTCTSSTGLIEDCPLFNIQTEAECEECKFEVPDSLKDEDCAGPAPSICGNPAIQSGPARATAGSGGSSGGSTTAKPSSTKPLVPTLSYSTGRETFASDKYGGGVTVERVKGGADGPTLALTTAAPTAGAADGDAEIVSTTIYTSGGVVYDMAIAEVDVTVTATAEVTETAAAKHKRHFAQHRHRRDY
ncbi:uncharacterized protein K452DRAFT_230488 [Aplosporella prunicola CBS 121167]|uniref:DUF1996 domain-containing protein n=1 Tax=Aplosporella prunicola CBS 121167 TaxID=1176127 RepID=A0A6A6BCZ4_9PEZI|nr:uncharacterized protein K452DRAFT_230488 [Aplosporella prunicola CBS 121167]KAF2140371.1 hypothetical protein K452DRAFT_230488 [Aplosporella prunicola CBS 121167]